MANPWEYLSDADKKRYGIVDRPPQAPQPTGADYATNLRNSARDALAGIGLSPDLLSAPTPISAPSAPQSSGLSVLGNIFQHKPDLPAYQPSDSGGGGFLSKVAGLGADIRDTAGDVAHGRIGALGTDAKDAVMGIPGALSSVTLDPAAQYVGKPFFGIAGSVLSEPIDPVTGQRKQQNIFEQLSDPGNFLGGIKEGLLHPQRAANAMDARARENYGAIGQAAYNVADQPFSYVGPGAVGALKGILPEGIAASRSVSVLGGLLNQGGGRAVVGGALGGIAGQQGAEALGLPAWAQTGAALAGGVVGGGIGLATTPKNIGKLGQALESERGSFSLDLTQLRRKANGVGPEAENAKLALAAFEHRAAVDAGNAAAENAPGYTPPADVLDASATPSLPAEPLPSSLPQPAITSDLAAGAQPGEPVSIPHEFGAPSSGGSGAGLPPAPPTSGPPLPPMSGDFARSVPIPDVGTPGAQADIAAKQATNLTTGALGSKVYRFVPGSKKLSALLNPSVAQDPQIHVAQLAKSGTRAKLGTAFNTAMRDKVAAVKQALIDSPAKYIGPADNKIAGTFKDIADHPDFYQIPPQLRVAIDDWSKAQWDQVSQVARTQYGVDVAPYDSGISGSVYAPTVPTRESMDAKIAATGRDTIGTGARSMAKERAYAGAYERMKADPKFQPVTSVDDLTALHNQAMASNAANETFKLAAGGLNKADLMAQTHPKLVTMRDEAMAKVTSLRNRLATAETRATGTTNITDELSKALEAARNADPETDFGAVETALRNSNKRLDALLTRRDISSANAGSLRNELADARDTLTEVRDAWKTADPTRGTDLVMSPITNRYHSPEAAKTLNEISRTATGFGKGIVDAMDEVRASHLNGDASPIFVQGLLGFFQDPILASKTVAGLVTGHRSPAAALEQIAKSEPETVARYTFATGRQFGQPLAEFTTAKGLGRIGAFKAADDQMFAISQNMAYQQWKHDSALLQRMNPAMTATEADHEAANLLSKTVPSLNPTERGLSPLRSSVERAGLTSASFAASPALLAKDMTSAMVKIAHSVATDPGNIWGSLSGREQLALIRGGTMLGTITALSGASAALSAESRGLSPADAIQEAMDPREKMFMAIQLGNGTSVPIGGPLRSFARAIAPAPGEVIPGTGLGKWAYGKLNSPISGALNLFRNEDYKGASIRSGDFPQQLMDTLRYGMEQVAPTSIGAISADQRAGQGLGAIGLDVGGQLLGANPSVASPTESLNQIARDYPGSNGKDFYSLEPYQQDEIKKLHPDLWAQKVAAGQDSTQQAQLIKDKVSAQQQASDAQLLAGTLTPKDWADQRTQRLAQLRGTEDVIYQGKSNPKPPTDPTKIDAYIAQGGTARDRFFRAIDAYSDPGTNAPNWDKVDEWQAAQPQVDQDYIARNTGLGGTPLEKLRRQLSSDYYGMPEFGGKINGQAISLKDAGDIKDLLNLVHGNTKTTVGVRTNPALYVATLQKMARSGQVDKNSVAYKGAIRGLLGLLPDNPDRTKYRKAHPEVKLLSGQTPLTPAEIAAVQARLAA